MFKKSLIAFFIFLSISSAQSQVYETKWGLGIGGTYPRFFSVSGEGYARNTNYGGYISAERYFNENISLRFLINFIYMESNYFAGGIGKVQSVNHLAGNLDVIYKFIPCRMISPYIVFGLGSTVFKSDNSLSQDLDDKTIWGYQANFGLGIEWGISKFLSLKTEAVYRTASNNKIDGNKGINENYKGVFGGNGDTYATFDLGVIWYFSKGDQSKLCDRCPQGITEIVKTDTIIIKEPIEIVQLDTIQIEKPILIGVHFEFDKYDLRPESYSVLNHAVEILKKFSDIKVKIDGHTDSFGTNDYNIQLSERRVNTVYNYLVSKGISGDRINKNWYGEERPVKDNDSPINRAFNRRVEIKVLN